MTFHTLYRNNRNCLMTVADVLGLATIVMLVFLTTCQVTSPTPHVAAANATTILGDHHYDYQSLLSKIAGGGWKPPRSRFVHSSSETMLVCCSVYLPHVLAALP